MMVKTAEEATAVDQEIVLADSFTPLRGGAASRLYKRIGVGLAISDGACLAVALGVSYVVRFGFQPVPTDWLITALASPFIWVAVFHAFRLHSPQHLSSWEEFTRTISACSIGVVVVVLASYWSKSSFSRAWVGLTWLSVVLLELAVRRIWRFYTARLRHKGTLRFRTLIVGTNDQASELAHELRRPDSGYLALGCVSVDAAPRPPVGDLPVVGSLDDLADALETNGADCLFVAATGLDVEQMARVAQIARRAGAEVRVVANLPEMLAPRLSIQSVGSFMALSLRPVQLSGLQAAAKRTFDLLIAIPVLVLTLPVTVISALAIKLESSGRVLFIQDRVTRNGLTFRMLKFRTMREGSHEDVIADVDTSTPFFKLQDDPRLTKVGKLLRRLSIDELPQLWNVIRGEMSLVGPRPLPVDQVAANKDLLSPRLEVKAGMTGWWQIQGRSDLDLHESLRLDIFYIENWSLGLDLYILLKTAGAVVRTRGAY